MSPAAGVQELRAGILTADPGITEHVTWNAPSYRFGGEDRVTFRLQPRDQLQLTQPRGARRHPGAGMAPGPAAFA